MTPQEERFRHEWMRLNGRHYGNLFATWFGIIVFLLWLILR